MTTLKLAACAAALILWAGPALAQDTGAQASTVTPYPPAFFTEFRPNTAMDMIGRLPGFSFDGGSFERGFAGTAGNVLIDGERPPSRSDGLSQVLSRIPASSVARIDLIRGGAPGIDMQGKTTIANIIRKPEAGLTGSAFGRLDIDDEHGFEKDIELQARREKDGRRMEASLAVGSYLDEPHPTRIRQRPDGTIIERGESEASYPFKRAQASGSYESALAGGRLRLNSQLGYETGSDYTRETLVIPGGEILSRGGFRRIFGEGGLRFTRNIVRGYDVELVGFHSQSERQSRGGSDFPAFSTANLNDDRSGESIGSATLHSPAYGKWKFDVGTEAAFNWAEGLSFRTVNGNTLDINGDRSHVEELRFDSKAVATWRPSPAFNLEAGLRYERSTITAGPVEKTLGYLKPRVNLSWTPKTGNQFGLRVERTVDQLNFDAFRSSIAFNSVFGDSIVGVGNNELAPAHQWITEARYERRWAREGVFSLRVTNRQIDDYVSRKVLPGSTVEYTTNIGEAEGTVYAVSLGLPLDRFGIKGGLLKTDLNFRESNLMDPVDTSLFREISGEAPYDWQLTLTQNIQSLNLTWGFFANGADVWRNYSPRSIATVQNATRVRFDVVWRPRPDLTVTGGIRNINKGANNDHLVFYDAPRDRGAPLYTQDSDYTGFRSVFVSVRKEFN